MSKLKHRQTNIKQHRRNSVLVAAFILVVVILVGALALDVFKKNQLVIYQTNAIASADTLPKPKSDSSSYELEKLKATTTEVDTSSKPSNDTGAYELGKLKTASTEAEKSVWYLKLIEKVGPLEAQDKLNSLGDWTGSTHLVDHTVGNYLYKKYGSSGIAYCKDYFGGACYHGVLLNFLGTPQQDTEIGKALLYCQKQGNDIPMACSHAIGHGLLAQAGYKNLPKAFDECSRTHSIQPLLSLIDCQDGVFMENIFGVHDGSPSPDRWIKATDLNYPCNDPRFANYLEACWRNQLFRVREVVGAYNYPVLEKYCEQLSGGLKSVCFSGIYRIVSSQTKNNLSLAATECMKIVSDSGGENCVMNVADYSFFQGDRTTMLNYCNQLTGSTANLCFGRLISRMKDKLAPNEQAAYCDKILSTKWRANCQNSRERT